MLSNSIDAAPFRLTAIASTIVLALAGQAQAQTAQAATPAAAASAAGDGAQLEDVVVTAQKRSQKLQDVPVAITAIGGETLKRDTTIKTANDITQFIPNAQASATDGRTRPRWFLRGIGTNETAASTVSPIGIYQDEVYLNNVYIQGFPLFDSERVEVLRGPQGTLWGKNTTGGAINYISRKPTFDTDGYARVGFGSFGERSFQGAVGGTLIPERLAGRISFFNERRDGWVENRATGTDAGAVKDQAVRGQLLWLLNEDLDALISFKQRDLKGDKSPSFYFLDKTVATRTSNPVWFGPQSNDAIAQAGRFEEELDSDGGSLRLRWQLGGYQLTSITAYDTGHRILWGGSPIEVDISRSRDEARSRQTTQELRLASPKEDRFSWILGAYWFKENLTTNEVARTDVVPGTVFSNTTGSSALNFELTDSKLQTRSYAVFGSGTFKVNEKVDINAGLRKSWEKKEYSVAYRKAATGASFYNNVSAWWQPNAISALGTPVNGGQDASWDEITYDLSPQWKVNDNVNAYFRYSHGFRAGGFVQNAGVVTRLDPESLDAYEVGVKTQWLGGRLTFNSALFRYDYKDIIVGVLLSVPGQPGQTRQVQENAATGKVKGAEFELQYAVTPRLRVGGSLGLLQTDYTNYFSSASGQTINATGNSFTRSPKTSVTLNAEYAYPLSSGDQIGAGTDWSFRTRQYFNAVTQNNDLLAQDAYVLGNARVFYRRADGRLEVSAFVRNVTDEVYSVLATGPSAGRVREVYGLPRSFGVSANWSFK